MRHCFFRKYASQCVHFNPDSSRIITCNMENNVVKSIMNRRHALLAALALPLTSITNFSARSQPRQSTYFPRPFAGSRTVVAFATELIAFDYLMPIALNRAIHVELTRPIARRDSFEDELRRAKVFSFFAIKTIAPHHLRRAGYEEQAAACESVTVMVEGGRAAADAQHTIGTEMRNVLFMPPLLDSAYDASAHACNSTVNEKTLIHAGAQRTEWVAMSGWHCAHALNASIYAIEENGDLSELAWVLEAMVSVINRAMRVSAEDVA
jgi:hypothetical protein